MAKQHSPRFLAIVESARSKIGECSADDLPELIDSGGVIIDVRERYEFDSGHLIGAIHIGKGVIERDIEKHNFSTEEKLILYCGGGFRSAIAAKSLRFKSKHVALGMISTTFFPEDVEDERFARCSGGIGGLSLIHARSFLNIISLSLFYSAKKCVSLRQSLLI